MLSVIINALLVALAFIVLLILFPQAAVPLLIVGTITLCIVGIVNYSLARKRADRLHAILQAVEEIRSGNLDAQIPTTAHDEVGALGSAIAKIAQKLRDDMGEMNKLQRVRSEFLGNVSHELRTPIFSMQGFLETLLNGAVDDPNVNREFLKKAYTHSQRLNALLGELITISQIESGEMKMSFRYFNLAEFIAQIVEEFRPTAEHYHARLQVAAGVPKDVQVLGDKERLRVVFENLFENAIKYNKPNGDVTVSCEPHDGHVVIRVSDTGVGIAQEHHSRIFERFYRVDKNRSREVGGTGLGLAIVKHIVEAHGSVVEVKSEVGKGSTFSFSLKT